MLISPTIKLFSGAPFYVNNVLSSARIFYRIGRTESLRVRDVDLSGGARLFSSNQDNGTGLFENYAEVGYQATVSLLPAMAFRGPTTASEELGCSAEVWPKLA